MTMQHILIIDDDLTFAIMLKAWLKEKGYEFKPISEFIYKDNYVIDHAGMQKLN